MGDYLNLGSDGNAGPMTVNSAPGRVFGTAFRPSTARPVLCLYTCRIIGGTSARGHIEFRSDSANPPTTVRCRFGFGDLAMTCETVLPYIVPPGHFVRLVTVDDTGAVTYLLTDQTEIVL